MTEADPDQRADELEHEADELEQRSELLAAETKEVRQDWERKRDDPNVPGAPPHPDDERGGSEDAPEPDTFPAKR